MHAIRYYFGVVKIAWGVDDSKNKCNDRDRDVFLVMLQHTNDAVCRRRGYKKRIYPRAQQRQVSEVVHARGAVHAVIFANTNTHAQTHKHTQTNAVD